MLPVYIDNWYTSEKLFTHLEAKGTAACDTARKNRLNLPKTLRDCKFGTYEFSFRRDGNNPLPRQKRDLLLVDHSRNEIS